MAPPAHLRSEFRSIFRRGAAAFNPTSRSTTIHSARKTASSAMAGSSPSPTFNASTKRAPKIYTAAAYFTSSHDGELVVVATSSPATHISLYPRFHSPVDLTKSPTPPPTACRTRCLAAARTSSSWCSLRRPTAQCDLRRPSTAQSLTISASAAPPIAGLLRRLPRESRPAAPSRSTSRRQPTPTTRSSPSKRRADQSDRYHRT